MSEIVLAKVVFATPVQMAGAARSQVIRGSDSSAAYIAEQRMVRVTVGAETWLVPVENVRGMKPADQAPPPRRGRPPKGA